MTPLCDVLSAQPAFDAGQLRQNRFRLSMAVGTKRHYDIDRIQPRHFVQTAAMSGIGGSIVAAIMDGLVDRVPGALADTLDRLPAGFPAELAASIQQATLRRLRLLKERPR